MKTFFEIQSDGSTMLVTAYWVESKGWQIIKREVWANEAR